MWFLFYVFYFSNCLETDIWAFLCRDTFYVFCAASMDAVYLCVVIAAALAFSAVVVTLLWATVSVLCPWRVRRRKKSDSQVEGEGESEAESEDGGFAPSDEGDIVFSPLRAPSSTPAAPTAPTAPTAPAVAFAWLLARLRPAPAPPGSAPPPSPHLLVVTDPHYSPDPARARSRYAARVAPCTQRGRAVDSRAC